MGIALKNLKTQINPIQITYWDSAVLKGKHTPPQIQKPVT